MLYIHFSEENNRMKKKYTTQLRCLGGGIPRIPPGIITERQL